MSHMRNFLSALLLALAASHGLAAFPDGESKATPSPKSLDAQELAARIDAFIDASLAARGIEPAPLATDAEFMRRVFLDLAGRIPSEAEARSFLANQAPDRRAKLVEALLGSPLYVRHMANTWQGVMGPSAGEPHTAAHQPGFRSWLDMQVQANAPYDKMVRELLTAPMHNPQFGYIYSNSVNPNFTFINPGFEQNLNPNFNFSPNLNFNPGFNNKGEKIFNPNPNPKIPGDFNPGLLQQIQVEDLNPRIKPIRNPKNEVTKEILIQAQTDTIEIKKRPNTPKVSKLLVEPNSPKRAINTAYLVNNAGNVVSPGAYFFEANEYKPENLAASTARRFLGVRLECAQCHNHPFSKWTRKQFWEFAAFFGNVQPQFDANLVLVTNISPNGVASLQPAKTPGELTMPGTDKIVKARFLDGTSPVFNANKEARQMLAEWMTSPSNPYFARTGANRLWAHFFGIGIIDPIDDEPSDENPASHPELLNELTAQFVAHQYDVQFLIRAIVSSKAYQRASAATHSSQNEARTFARMAVKGLTPEQLFDNLALATGYQDGTAHQPGVIVPNTPRGEFLALFTTPDRKTETQTSILQALTMMNGKIVTDATSVTGNHKLALLLNSSLTNVEKIEALYLGTLSRLPRSEEAARMLRHIDSRNDVRAAFGDIFWALLNSAEFRFNH